MVRRSKPSFSPDQEERLLAFMEETRGLALGYEQAQPFRDNRREAEHELCKAIDKVAECITGNPELYWAPHHIAGGTAIVPESVRKATERKDNWAKIRATRD